ncbi:Hypothetical protein GLP15_2862 [Giardia lamblia P15]|uniref:Uncharacterized protein n=1 Tax=Giardia intestinalis (strain P15) TaxID=658858 RepID=E1F1W8_GIAIA|nr:Hypothetical protein GLP15_2862 [Giardia lamblia P15]
MPRAPVAIDTIDAIMRLEHEEMRLQLLELAKLSSDSKKLTPINEVIPTLQAMASNEPASEASIQTLSGILSSIYSISNQDIVEMISQQGTSPRSEPTNATIQLCDKDGDRVTGPQDSFGTRSAHLQSQQHEVGKPISPGQTEKKIKHVKPVVINEDKDTTENQPKVRRRSRIKLELKDGATVSSVEPSIKRKHVPKKQARLETLQSVSHLVVLFNVPTKGDATAVPYVYLPNLWLGCLQSISYESFLSLEKLISRSEFLSVFGLLPEARSTDSQIPTSLVTKRTSSALPPEQPKNDIDMRASLASLLSTSSEYRTTGMVCSLSGKPRTPGQSAMSLSTPSFLQIKKDPVLHLLTQLLLATNGISLTMPSDTPDDSPISTSEFALMKEVLEYSLYYQNACFFEQSALHSKQWLNNAMDWASTLLKTANPSDSTEVQSLLSSLAPHIKPSTHDPSRKRLASYIYISLSLRRWLNIQQSSSPSRPLSSLQRVIIAKLKLPNPLPAAHNLDSDSRLVFFSKRIVSQALLNLYYNSSSTIVAQQEQPYTHLTKYLLPMGIPPVRLVLLDEPLHGPLFDPYEKYFLMSVHHPELQFLVAPPRYLDKPTFMQSPGASAPHLGPTRVTPRLALKIEQKSGCTNLVLDEAIDPGTCIMDVVGCYLPIEEAHRILCYIVEEGLRSGHSYSAVWSEVIRYSSHCIYLEGLRVIVDMNCCSSLSVYVQFDELDNKQEAANCELGLCYSLDYVICRLYSTVAIPSGSSIRLPLKYQWLNRQVPMEITGCTTDDMRRELIAKHIKGCEDFLTDSLDSILAIPAYDPFSGGYSLLSYPGPYLSLIKEIIAVMMSVSYREASKFTSADYLSLLETCRIGLRNPGPGYTNALPKSAQARVTLQRNIELAQRLVFSIMMETKNLNLFLALDRDNLLDKQLIDTDTLIPVIAQKLKGCYLYSHRCRHVANGTPPTPGSSSAVFLKQAMDNRANAVKRIGTEYNHFLLLYRIAFAVQAMEDLFSHPVINDELFIQADTQIFALGYTELELETLQEQSSDQDDVKSVRPTLTGAQKKEQIAAQAAEQVTIEPSTDTPIAPTRINLKLKEVTEQESKSPSPHIAYDKHISECQTFYIQEPYAPSPNPYIDLSNIRLVSTLDYLLGESVPEKNLASMITEDEMRRGLSNALGYGY